MWFTTPWYWVVHATGVDFGVHYGSWVWYNFWSGFGGDVAILASILAAPVLLWRKNECGVRWCWRLGHHDLTDPDTGLTHVLCRKHHPMHPGKPVTVEHIRDVCHLYLGKKPGEG